MKKILVADDMAIFREPIAAALRRESYELLTAANGLEALQLAESQVPDLILMDVAMPEMDGIACLEALRALPNFRDTPVIMLTAIADREIIAKAIKVGIQGYLLKSRFSLEELTNRVQKLLNPPELERPEAEPSQSQPAQSGRQAVPKPESTPELPQAKSKPEVIRLIREELQLHALPPVLHHVIALTSSPRSTIDEVAEAACQDQALAVKVMKVANSSFYGGGKYARNLKEAAQRIGLAGVRNSILAILAIEHFGEPTAGHLTSERFWEHALVTAILAQHIGQITDPKTADQLFLAALLHDVGRMVLSTVLPDDYAKLLAFSDDQGADLTSLESRYLGITHADVTRVALTKWQLPKNIVEPAYLHELSVDKIRRAARDPKGALAVALANRLAHALALGNSGNPMLLPLHDHIEALDLEPDTVRNAAREAVRNANEMAMFYASQSKEEFSEPLAAELARKADAPIKLAVLASTAHVEPLSLFFEQLNWLDAAEPELAIMYVPLEKELAQRLRELQNLEERIQSTLPVLLASTDESLALPTDLQQSRPCATIHIPCHYTDLIQTIVETTNSHASCA